MASVSSLKKEARSFTKSQGNKRLRSVGEEE